MRTSTSPRMKPSRGTRIYALVGAAAGVGPNILHVPSQGITASAPEVEQGLWGDKSHSAVFDNSKLRSLVPGFKATVPFSEGIKGTIAWFDEDPSRQGIDEAANRRWDKVAEVYEEALRRVAVSADTGAS